MTMPEVGSLWVWLGNDYDVTWIWDGGAGVAMIEIREVGSNRLFFQHCTDGVWGLPEGLWA